METDGGGWTVFQRRVNGSVDFYRNWADYEEGFGYLDHEFWLGLSKIHRLTEDATCTLRVDLGDAQGNRAYANYSTFSIEDSSTEYTLTIAGYSGTAGDSMTRHDLNGTKFSTKDNENDNWSSNCATHYQGAWWYNRCTFSNLNGLYDGSSIQGIVWYDWKNRYEPLKFSEMKICCSSTCT